LKTLDAVESQEVLDCFDRICVVCGHQPLSPLLKQIDKQYPIAGLSFWDMIFKNIAMSIGNAFGTVEAELTRALNDPARVAEMAANLQEQMNDTAKERPDNIN